MNTVNSSTGFSPFQLKLECSPWLIPPLSPLPARASGEKKMAHNIINQLQKDIQEAQDNLLAAKVHQAYYINKRRGEEEVYEVGDFIMLMTKHCHREYKRKGKK
ncbi:hypothetical protein J132_01165 [Termitomyces sp. J132]|nr:hypothetical protein J132_01165 [Termitomyces sp. J132]